MASKELDIYYAGDKSMKLVSKLFSVDIPWETDYTFKFVGDEHEKHNFLTAMRMTVSRARKQAKEAGKPVKEFRVVTLEDKPAADGNGFLLTLQRVRSEMEQAASMLPELEKVTDAMGK